MKKFLLAIMFVLGTLIANSQVVQLYVDAAGDECTIKYGTTKVWVEVDGSWFQTYIYETVCPICHHYYDCYHRHHHYSIYTIDPAAAYIGASWYFARPHYRPAYYKWHTPNPKHYAKPVYGPHKPAPKQAPKPAPRCEMNHNAPVYHNHISSRPTSTRPSASVGHPSSLNSKHVQAHVNSTPKSTSSSRVTTGPSHTSSRSYSHSSSRSTPESRR